MRWPGIFLASMFLLATVAAQAAEVDGFRGLNWGADLANLSSTEFTKILPVKGIAPGMECYQRKNDPLRLDGIEVESITYNFKKGKLVSVNIDFSGFYNYQGLLNYCKTLFGPETMSTAKNQELVSSFQAPKTGALLFFQVGAPQFSFGRLFLFSRDWLQ